jgi:hypothetical protein
MPDEKHPSDDLADALGNLEGGQPDKPDHDVPVATDLEDDTADLAESESMPAAAPRRRRSGAGTRSRSNRAPTQLARQGVKVCMVIGMLLLIPALWAVAILLDLPVPMSGRKSATAMALLMLLCWPIAGALIWGAFHFAKQHAKFDAQQAGD